MRAGEFPATGRGTRLPKKITASRVLLIRCAELDGWQDRQGREQRGKTRHGAGPRRGLSPGADRRILECATDC
jgi:hypothetical protein